MEGLRKKKKKGNNIIVRNGCCIIRLDQCSGKLEKFRTLQVILQRKKKEKCPRTVSVN